MQKSCPLTAPKPSAKNAVDSRVAKVGLPSSRTCVGINVRRVWRTIARGAAKPWEPSGTGVCETRTSGNNRHLHYFSTGGKNFADKRPPFWGPETDPKTGAKSSGHKQIKLRLNEWPPFWGPFLGSQNGGRFVGKILVTGRKIARVSIVSARTRQKFSMPLLFHGFAAPQALVLHTLRTFMATHVLELGRPSVAGPVFARVFGPQTGVQKNHFFRSLEGAKSLENL